MPVTLPSGEYGTAYLTADGVIAFDVEAAPLETVRDRHPSRQIDVIIREGAFTDAEKAQITRWWSRYLP